MKGLLTFLAALATATTLQARDYTLLCPSEIALCLEDGSLYGGDVRFRKTVRKSVNQTLAAPIFKRSRVQDIYNELTLKAKDFDLVFRASDEGVAGPADYTQGAMRNAVKENYAPVWGEPMSQGTRCRQLAEYLVFDATFTMLCDTPSTSLPAVAACCRSFDI